MKFRHSLVAAAMLSASTFTAFATEVPYVDSSTVRQVQQILNDRGFRTGVDGLMGPRTQAALRQFQKSENLHPTGQLNRQTLVALGIQQAASAGSTAQPQYGPEVIRRVQRTLNHRGFDAGAVDGSLSPETRAALKAFQKSENLQETGQLNPGTLSALGVSPDAAVAGEQAPPPSAMVRQVQERLNRRGYGAGAVDGRMGPSTRAALQEFQRSENLPVTGRADRDTLSALGLSGPLAATR